MTGLFSRVINKLFTLTCKFRLKKLGKKVTLSLPMRLYGEKSISIGSEVFIGRNSWLNVLGFDQGVEAILDIGDGTSIAGDCCISAAKSVVIEEFVLIGRFVHISDHSHEYSLAELPVKKQGITEPKPVRIKSGAWLGQGVVVCPGVTVGKNAVIGANAVVKKDVPDYCIAVGIPAKVVKMLDK